MALLFYHFVKLLSAGIDLISNDIVGHHKRVSYISVKIAERMGLKTADIKLLIQAALLHDLGVFFLNQQYEDLNFDSHDDRHARIAHLLMENYFPEDKISEIVLFHHQDWNYGEGEDSPPVSRIIYLADRLDSLIDKDKYILNQVPEVVETISDKTESRFFPEAVKAFKELADFECFWLGTGENEIIEKKLDYYFAGDEDYINLEQFYELCETFSHIIDFRSPFTATHSKGVSIVSRELAGKASFTTEEVNIMEIAGLLHDIGKLIVPVEILNKPARLDKKEWNIMRSHTFYTYQVLNQVKGLEVIRDWASYHHEKLNGNGYPFHLQGEKLTTGSRIVQVADVFTALTEDRPYRKGMKKNKTRKILDMMVKDGEMDGEIVKLLFNNYDEINGQREKTQTVESAYYQRIRRKIEGIR